MFFFCFDKMLRFSLNFLRKKKILRADILYDLLLWMYLFFGYLTAFFRSKPKLYQVFQSVSREVFQHYLQVPKLRIFIRGRVLLIYVSLKGDNVPIATTTTIFNNSNNRRLRSPTRLPQQLHLLQPSSPYKKNRLFQKKNPSLPFPECTGDYLGRACAVYSCGASVESPRLRQWHRLGTAFLLPHFHRRRRPPGPHLGYSGWCG